MLVAPVVTRSVRSVRRTLVTLVAGWGLVPAPVSTLVSLAPLGVAALVAEWVMTGPAAAQSTDSSAARGSTVTSHHDTATSEEPQRFGLVPKTFLINLGGYLPF